MKIARLHEFIIRFSKYVSLGGGIAILFYIWSKSQAEAPIQAAKPVEQNIASASNAPSYDITLSNPLFKGFNKDLEPYIVKARKAVKTSEQKYKFDRVEADYYLEKIPYYINANGGVLDDNTKWLYLNDGVKVTFNDFNLISDEVAVNLDSKESYSNSFSIITFKTSKVMADSYHSSNENNIVKFKGHVKTQIHLRDF